VNELNTDALPLKALAILPGPNPDCRLAAETTASSPTVR
jgi:hypothetical protein